MCGAGGSGRDPDEYRPLKGGFSSVVRGMGPGVGVFQSLGDTVMNTSAIFTKE